VKTSERLVALCAVTHASLPSKTRAAPPPQRRNVAAWNTLIPQDCPPHTLSCYFPAATARESQPPHKQTTNTLLNQTDQTIHPSENFFSLRICTGIDHLFSQAGGLTYLYKNVENKI
jgi:hypothetical protein